MSTTDPAGVREEREPLAPESAGRPGLAASEQRQASLGLDATVQVNP
jgi:hypothetical protein